MKYNVKPFPYQSIKDMPVSERPRERLYANGAKSLSDLDLLCLLLGAGTNGRPVHELAEDVLKAISQCGGNFVPEVFCSIDGLGRAKASLLCACLEFGRRQSFGKSRRFSDPHDVFEMIRHYGDREQEHFLCIMLNGAYEVMGINVITIGLVNRTLVHPREVFSEPLKQRATAIIIAHNHPSGNLEPSEEDVDVTIRIRKAGELLGIQLLDHIIFSSENYYSLMECGQLCL